jgi:hypothetical protein
LFPEVTSGMIFFTTTSGTALGHTVLCIPVVCFPQKQRKSERRQRQRKITEIVNCPVPVHICSMNFWRVTQTHWVWSARVKTNLSGTGKCYGPSRFCWKQVLLCLSFAFLVCIVRDRLVWENYILSFPIYTVNSTVPLALEYTVGQARSVHFSRVSPANIFKDEK